MNGFYKITQALQTQLKAKGIRVVTLGDNFKIDIARQTIFPYAHIIPTSAIKQGSVTSWGFRIVVMDAVDFNKDDLRDLEQPFYTTDNLQDVLNDIHNRLSNLIEYFTRGDGSEELMKIDVDADIIFTPFLERYENLLAGWEIDIQIKLPTGGTKC